MTLPKLRLADDRSNFTRADARTARSSLRQHTTFRCHAGIRNTGAPDHQSPGSADPATSAPSPYRPLPACRLPARRLVLRGDPQDRRHSSYISRCTGTRARQQSSPSHREGGSGASAAVADEPCWRTSSPPTPPSSTATALFQPNCVGFVTVFGTPSSTPLASGECPAQHCTSSPLEMNETSCLNSYGAGARLVHGRDSDEYTPTDGHRVLCLAACSRAYACSCTASARAVVSCKPTGTGARSSSAA